MYLELGGDGVLVHVDVVLVDGGHDELVALGLHPGGDEGRQVQARVPVQHQLVVDDLVRRLLGDRVLRHAIPAAAQRDQKSALIRHQLGSGYAIAAIAQSPAADCSKKKSPAADKSAVRSSANAGKKQIDARQSSQPIQLKE